MLSSSYFIPYIIFPECISTFILKYALSMRKTDNENVSALPINGPILVQSPAFRTCFCSHLSINLEAKPCVLVDNFQHTNVCTQHPQCPIPGAPSVSGNGGGCIEGVTAFTIICCFPILLHRNCPYVSTQCQRIQEPQVEAVVCRQVTRSAPFVLSLFLQHKTHPALSERDAGHSLHLVQMSRKYFGDFFINSKRFSLI